ncbi:FAD-dependent oxidoreductase [Paracoccus sp. WLY502]|uniref:FAD-dependent oxidoreductase n=1 Tax=Paracoccus yibinensis TaxID=3068891 RepID=UPI0027963CF9|nr:bifunctional TVP38/TMEM64 family protein/FAD-dependent oxidoreductase [Paracoccus sp. WLY502]MDQ1901627.1 FAD-dependent oxidoreductase [Paracoccus sp. WLY502]
MKKPLLFALLAVLVILSAWLLSGRDLGPRTVAVLQAGIDTHPLTTMLLFFVSYVAVTALSLPIATLLTLLGGALFGFWQGLLMASFASAIGATLALLAARYMLRDWVRVKLGARVRTIQAELDQDGAYYLFSLRLIPVVPFFAVNLLMGLTAIRVQTFYWVSQLGMLPGTAVYANAGTQLGQVDDLSEIVGAPIVISLAALAAFPWVARAVLGAARRRRVYRGWTRPARFDRNLVVIGAGSAGLVAAYVAAAAKARVTLVEAGEMGGDCLNTGCVPSKTLIRSATVAWQMRNAARWGLRDTPPAVPFRAVMARVHEAIARVAPHDSVERYTGLGVEVLRGHARLVDPWTVQVTDPQGATRRLTTRAVIVATGARPTLPPLPGLDLVDPLTSETLWTRLADRDEAPRRLVVLGGGPVGCELAQAFARLGSTVTQIEAAPRLLQREDSEVSDLVAAALRDDGVTVLTGHRALACGQDGDRWIDVAGDDTTTRIAFDQIIVAVGRSARLQGFGLEDLGIATGCTIEVNDFLETRFPNILAAGDVAGPFQFTHFAADQAWFASVNALFGGLARMKASDRIVPWAIFTDPEVARVGLSEAEARQQGIAVEVTRLDLAGLDRAVTDGATRGFVKVLTPPGRDRILGVTVVGHHAGDTIAEFVLAMRHGLGLGKILSTIHIYPTWSEAAKSTSGAWRRAHMNPRVLSLLERFHGWRRG